MLGSTDEDSDLQHQRREQAPVRAEKPDVVALQELKAADREFPKAAIEKVGYGAVWCGQKTWNGVAILARGCEPILTRRELPGDPDDRQARYFAMMPTNAAM